MQLWANQTHNLYKRGTCSYHWGMPPARRCYGFSKLLAICGPALLLFPFAERSRQGNKQEDWTITTVKMAQAPRLEPGMCARTPVTSVNFRVLLTFPRLSHVDCFLYFLSLWRLFLFIVGFVFPVSTPCFSIFKAHYPESHSLPFQSRANIHESYVLQEKE